MKAAIANWFRATRIPFPDGSASYMPGHVRPDQRGESGAHVDPGPADPMYAFLALDVNDQIDLVQHLGASFNGLLLRLDTSGHLPAWRAKFDAALAARRGGS